MRAHWRRRRARPVNVARGCGVERRRPPSHELACSRPQETCLQLHRQPRRPTTCVSILRNLSLYCFFRVLPRRAVRRWTTHRPPCNGSDGERRHQAKAQAWCGSVCSTPVRWESSTCLNVSYERDLHGFKSRKQCTRATLEECTRTLWRSNYEKIQLIVSVLLRVFLFLRPSMPRKVGPHELQPLTDGTISRTCSDVTTMPLLACPCPSRTGGSEEFRFRNRRRLPANARSTSTASKIPALRERQYGCECATPQGPPLPNG